MSETKNKYSPEVRERAVRMVLDNTGGLVIEAHVMSSATGWRFPDGSGKKSSPQPRDGAKENGRAGASGMRIVRSGRATRGRRIRLARPADAVKSPGAGEPVEPATHGEVSCRRRPASCVTACLASRRMDLCERLHTGADFDRRWRIRAALPGALTKPAVGPRPAGRSRCGGTARRDRRARRRTG